MKFESTLLGEEDYTPRSLYRLSLNYNRPIKEWRCLDQSENLFPPSSQVKAELRKIGEEHYLISTYPDPKPEMLINELASFHGIDREQIAVGVGSSSLILQILLGFEAPRGVATFEPTYGLYSDVIRRIGYKHYKVTIHNPFILSSLILEEELKKRRPSIAFVCNPNSPTGTMIAPGTLLDVIARYEDIVFIVDEAYADFVPFTVISSKMPQNLIVLKSFSKFYGVADIRVGYAVANTNLLKDVVKFSIPCQVSGFASRIARAALLSTPYYEDIRRQIFSLREKLFDFFAEGTLFSPIKSKTNFLLVKFNKSITELQEYYNYLLASGIVIRVFRKPPLEKYFRVGIAPFYIMDEYINITKEWIYDNGYSN